MWPTISSNGFIYVLVVHSTEPHSTFKFTTYQHEDQFRQHSKCILGESNPGRSDPVITRRYRRGCFLIWPNDRIGTANGNQTRLLRVTLNDFTCQELFKAVGMKWLAKSWSDLTKALVLTQTLITSKKKKISHLSLPNFIAETGFNQTLIICTTEQLHPNSVSSTSFKLTHSSSY